MMHGTLALLMLQAALRLRHSACTCGGAYVCLQQELQTHRHASRQRKSTSGRPAAGLDARAANIVMRCVKSIVQTGRTIVSTIHQPSIDIFEQFDELVLLKRGGETIYCGPLGLHSKELIAYFQVGLVAWASALWPSSTLGVVRLDSGAVDSSRCGHCLPHNPDLLSGPGKRPGMHAQGHQAHQSIQRWDDLRAGQVGRASHACSRSARIALSSLHPAPWGLCAHGDWACRE